MTNKKPLNPPAFPHMNPNVGLATGNYGMSLRDYFAAKAMQGYLMWSPDKITTTEHIANWSYSMADEMLKARENNVTG